MNNLFYRHVKNIFFNSIFIITVLFFHTHVYAQDTRAVHEPVIPKVCKILIADNKKDFTNEINNAIVGCAKQHKIISLLPSSKGDNYFFSGPIIIPSFGGILINKGVILSAINDPNLYDKGNQICGELDNIGKGCNPFITLKGENSGLYGEGYIDGQGGSILKNKKYTWWQLATEAKIKHKKQNNPHLIDIKSGKNISIYKLHLINSPNFHIVPYNTNGLTIWGIEINTPSDARNTDGIDPSSSQNITITHSNINTGDDNIAIKAGKNGPSKHISIIDNNFGHGHGMSIGSETNSGVSNVLVKNLTLQNATNGIRIKSDITRGGLVTDIYYENVCIFNVKNPIILDTHYSGKISEDKNIPRFKNIFFQNVEVLTPGVLKFDGLDEDNMIEVFVNNLHVRSGSSWVKNNVIIHGNIDNIIDIDICRKY
ncbi:hypothetical protein GJT93_02240 (plasmid) [Enterobacteriaceae endosymbiont of Donacia provostii]|uniref:glycoside hydrolase family 28 protein n=1 Tax=Enterobacteriaceae endosymbiont of Donacia provostii TaxID=2675781 RepID=UPI00144925CE|nr:glycosyl hydrolase family 28 protein [Enterobacteriaceae endosymbiont of Donacia provostii]QJC33916.1 hypothetical protein GJT93_02240 [Enterobacteriaceae endosymbiont of Donacia provostii]